jgi:glycine/D-amino acid oxidase-like deaminating enzyme
MMVSRLHFPGVVAEVKIEESCLYTVTPDWNPVIDVLPHATNIVIAAGFSGILVTTVPWRRLEQCHAMPDATNL